MQAANRLLKALKSGGTSFGVWQTLPGSNISRTLASTGVDWICVDTEHGNIDDGQMHEAVAALTSLDVSPIVRIPGTEPWMAKRALDTGAHGIVVPLVRTPEEAKGIVAAAKFPPRGIRGFGSPFANVAYAASKPASEQPSPADYLTQANDSLLTIIQIETREALENVDAIAAVDGVDVLFIGPHDLGIAIGKPVEIHGVHDDLKNAIAKIKAAADKNGKISGMFCAAGEPANMYAEQGFKMICAGLDVYALKWYLTDQIKKASGQ